MDTVVSPVMEKGVQVQVTLTRLRVPKLQLKYRDLNLMLPLAMFAVCPLAGQNI